MKTKYTLSLLALALCALPMQAQHETTHGILYSAAHGWEYGVKAGVNIGGTAPLPLPQEIRSIDGYSPKLQLYLEGAAYRSFGDRWGMATGIRLENKGMETRATVKNYNLSLVMSANEAPITGRFTGKVRTVTQITYLTIPALATYNLTDRWQLQGGLFVSCAFDRDFSGDASDGYLRDGSPIGQKVELSADQKASYDFADDMRRFQWGAQIGAEWKAFRHLTVHAALTWGFRDIFKSGFQTIPFAMYPIYLNLGFGYAF